MKKILFVAALFFYPGVTVATDITWDDKVTGGSFTADDANAIKTAVNSKADKTAALVGDCTVGPCLDGSTDGGNLIKLWAGTGSYWTALQGGAPAANRSWRLPIAAPPSAGETNVMTMDEHGQMGFIDKPSTSGYVLSSTDAGVLSWIANGAGAMVYPGAGLAVSTGSAWGTSLTLGTGVATALGIAVDTTGGLATYDSIPAITWGTGLTDTSNTISVTYPVTAEAWSGSGWNGDTDGLQRNDAYDYLHIADTDDDGLPNKVDVGDGVPKVASNIMSVATAGTDYSAPGTAETITANRTFQAEVTVGDGGDKIQTFYDSTPAADDTWSGAKMTVTAGESLAQWDIIYAKNASGTLKWYKYDANGTDKLLAPRAIALAAISADASGEAGIGNGIARNDGWSQTSNQDEGKDVWASGTAGAITLTKLSTSGDEVVRVGYVLEENVILFSLGNVTLVEVP